MEQQVEVLQASSLEGYQWPEEDPHSVPQRTRKVRSEDRKLILDCLASAEINLPAFLKEARKQGLNKADMVLRILSHQKFQMNPMTARRAHRDRHRPSVGPRHGVGTRRVRCPRS